MEKKTLLSSGDKWKRSLSCSGDAEAEDPGSLPARGYNMMAAMLRGTCPAIGKWSDLEFKNFFDLRVWNALRTLHRGGKLIL